MSASPAIIDYAKPHEPSRWPTTAELLVLGLLVTVASHAVPYWIQFRMGDLLKEVYAFVAARLGPGYYRDLWLLCFALLLVAAAPRRSGVRVDRSGRHWKAVLAITAVQWLLVATVYPNLTNRPFRNASASMWLLSPAAQELVFTGYLYGLFALRWPQRLHPRVPIDVALLVTAGFFAVWHLVNFRTISPGFVAFQLCYVFVLTCFSGMTRVLTGSVLYCVIIHTGVNFIAWAFS